MTSQKTILVTILASLVILAGVVYLMQVTEKSGLPARVGGSGVSADLFPTQEGGHTDLSAQSDTALSDRASWVAYSNDAYRFELVHPEDLTAIVHDEGDGAASIVFENEDLSSGFQIFVTPYAEPTITRARFLMDQPSGALEEPVSVAVDGASGMMFYGKNDDIGETKEIWFVKNGYLYEVYSYKTLEPLLLEVITTWKFK